MADQKLNKSALYLETTISSYLAARPSRDIVVQAHQQITWDWWNSCRGDYEIYISEIVLKEIAGGDQKAAERRYEFVKDLEILDISEDVRQLGRDLAVFLRLPKRAEMRVALKFCNRVRVKLPSNPSSSL
ncbi:DNA-binding protein [Methanosarcinales archaeon]|nr:MAG: DNA-binding protein [Methanosarcinales archaeon]